MLKALGLIGVVVNATMICFVGSQLAENEYEQEFIHNRFESARLWFITLLIEHVVLLLRFGLNVISPTDPKWIYEAKDILLFRRDLMKSGADLDLVSSAIWRKFSTRLSAPVWRKFHLGFGPIGGLSGEVVWGVICPTTLSTRTVQIESECRRAPV